MVRNPVTGRLAPLGAFLLAGVLVAAGGATTGSQGVVERHPPAILGSMAPNWVVGSATPALSWLEPTADGGHNLRTAELSQGQWQTPATIATGGRFFANWADLPAVAKLGDGSLVAHWLEKNGSGTYAYGIELARSSDGGAHWKRLGRLHDDATEAEHGFVSWIPEGRDLRAFWLDGRAIATGGAMALRTALVGAAVGPAEVLDTRVCDCCQTGAAASSEGPLVVFRDRSEDEVRDIAMARKTSAGWSQPALVAADGWKIPGCPVNGPQVAASGQQVAVAWFTGSTGGGARSGSRVRLAFSSNGGTSFDPPIDLEPNAVLGRVALSLDGDGNALVAWMASSNQQAEVRLRRVSPRGRGSAVLSIGHSTAGRASGFPRLTIQGESVFAAWVEAGAEKAASKLRVVEVPLALLPLR